MVRSITSASSRSLCLLIIMKIRTNKLIYTGWALYVISLVIPWSGKLFGGWLYGWFWQGSNFFPFFYYLIFQDGTVNELRAIPFVISIIIMFMSPILLVSVNKGASSFYGYIPVIGLGLAIISSYFVFFRPGQIPSPILLYAFGYCIYAISFGVLSIGFYKQMSYLRCKKSSA